jgi:flagellar biosynthesis regulator FlaF
MILKIWGDSVKKLKEKSRNTLKKHIFCMKALRNHQCRATKFIEHLFFNKLDVDKIFVDQD